MSEQIMSGSGAQYHLLINQSGGMHTQIGAPNINGYASLDPATNAFVTMTYEHHEIHEGDHFTICNFAVIGSPTSANFVLTTPASAKLVHMLFNIEGTSQTEFRVYEGTTASGGAATILTPINNNRMSAITSTAVVKLNPTVTASGTLLIAESHGFEAATPAKASMTGQINRNEELILKSGTSYLFAIKSLGVNNIVSYCGKWYEHTNKA